MVVRILIVLAVLTFVSCENDSGLANPDPSELVFEITTITTGKGDVKIEANAENTIEYAFHLGSDEVFIEKNDSGVFYYSFDQSGVYQITILAYGSSGRYIKKSKQAVIELESDSGQLPDGYSTPLSYDGYKLVFSDEFNGANLNSDNWTFETGNGCPNNCGWGNNELQTYTTDNAYVEGGALIIEAKKESIGDNEYSSARLVTKDKKSFQYGRIDIRAKLPYGQGIWPALWMLGNNISSAGWPACGEIDIMEMIGGGEGRDDTSHGTIHWDNNGNHDYIGKGVSLENGLLADEYHVYTTLWDEYKIKWLLDDTEFYQVDITDASKSEFHQNFFFIFNIAVGGDWPGSPNATTVFPQKMKVDYLRVFQVQ